MTSLKAVAEGALEWMRAQSPDVQAEIYLSRAEERGVELREGRLDAIQQASSAGAGLRILHDGRMAFASAGGADLETIKGLFERALPQLRHLEPDPHKGFPAPAAAEDKGLSATLWDESLFKENWEEVIPRLKDMEASALSFDKRITSALRVGYGESRGEVVLASTRGTLTVERGATASVGLSTLSSHDGELQVGSSFQSSRRKAALDFKKTALESAQRTVALLGAKKIPTGRRAVLFDPWIAGEFLDLVSGLLCADQIQRGKSLLAGKLGQKVCSPLVTFIDDPRKPEGVASSLYDDEGCPTAKKIMIEKGVIKDYFYDTYTASKDGRPGNASAGRGSYKGLPSPGCSNFYLAPGPATREQVIADTKDGILVLDVMGMHMADTISGEFSVGVSGVAVQDGRLSHAVKGAMISGNFVDLLQRIDAVASDLTFHGSLGAPTFRVSDMTVA